MIQVGFVLFHADLIDAGDGAPELAEGVDFVRVARHADHLHDDLEVGAALMLHLAEADEIVADTFELCAFAVVLEGFLGCSIEAKRDVLKRAN